MNRNAVIARKIAGIARKLVAGVENFGYYSIDFDEEKRTFTVYNEIRSWTDMKVIKDCLKWIMKKIGVALGHVLDFMVKVMDRIVEDD